MTKQEFLNYCTETYGTISVLLPDAKDDVVEFLINVSFDVTSKKKKR